MPRPTRYTSGGMVFHALNRGAGKRNLLDNEGEFAAFFRRNRFGQWHKCLQLLLLLSVCFFATWFSPSGRGDESEDKNKAFRLDEKRQRKLPVPGYYGQITGSFTDPVDKAWYSWVVIRATRRNDLIAHPPGEAGYALISSYHKGDIVPLFGRFYRVKTLFDFVMEPLPAADVPKHIPLNKDVYWLPLGNFVSLHGSRIYISEIEGTLAEPEKLRARVEYNPNEKTRPNLRSVVTSTKFQFARIGDPLQIPDINEFFKTKDETAFRMHKVVSIVPPDPANHIGGWVEIEHAIIDP